MSKSQLTFIIYIITFLCQSLNSWNYQPSSKFSKRSGHSTIIFKNELYVIGGWSSTHYLNDIWKSEDGLNQELVSLDNNFSGRSDFAAIVFNDKIQIFGGFNGTVILNDAWVSNDGIIWNKHSDLPFFIRNNNSAICVDNKLYVIGAYQENEILKLGNVQHSWFTQDLVHWGKIKKINLRQGFAAVNFRNELLVFGGQNGLNMLSDAWKSSDGIAYTKLSKNNFIGRMDHSAVIQNDEIQISFGVNWRGYINDIYKSADGIKWVRIDIPNMIERSRHTSIVFKERVQFIGGQDGTRNQNDIYVQRNMKQEEQKIKNEIEYKHLSK